MKHWKFQSKKGAFICIAMRTPGIVDPQVSRPNKSHNGLNSLCLYTTRTRQSVQQESRLYSLCAEFLAICASLCRNIWDLHEIIRLMPLERNKFLTVTKQFIGMIMLIQQNARSHLSNYNALNYPGTRYEHSKSSSVFIKQARLIRHRH